LSLPKTNTLEIAADISLESAEGLVLALRSGAKDARPVTIELSSAELKTGEADLSLAMDKSERNLNLRIFIDRSVLEVFVNETICATKVISPLDEDATLTIQPRGGTAQAKRIQSWPMKTIW
jgi:sucrose-6-phosphate hydrolase SacC (GH32 family)